MQTEPSHAPESASGGELSWRVLVLFFVGFLLLVLFVDWQAGTFRSEFGRNPDEGIHYVTGVLIREFARTPAAWNHPMAFARDFYAHYPKVGLGQWPPLFEIWQALWGFIAGPSRTSLLIGMGVLTAALAASVARATVKVYPSGGAIYYAILSGVLLILSPLTQEHAAMTMAEIPLALLSFLSVLAWIRFEASSGMKEGIVFGLLCSAAILTKGNAWVIPLVVPFAIVVNGRWSLLKQASFWVAVGLIAFFCVPFTLFTINIVRQGMNTPSLPTVPMILTSIVAQIRYVLDVYGWPISIVVIIGLLGATWRTGSTGPAPWSTFWRTMSLYAIGIVLFHGVVPTSFEPRKVYQIVPVLSLLVVAGLELLGRSAIVSHPPTAWFTRLRLSILCLALFLLTGFHWIKPFEPGLRRFVSELSMRTDSHRAAIVIASNAVYQDLEAAFIAEWISQNGADGTYLIRATKLLETVDMDESGQIRMLPVTTTGSDLLALLNQVPATYVLVHTGPAVSSYEHHEPLRRALNADRARWELIAKAETISRLERNEFELFKNRADTRSTPIHFEIDLSRKIRQSIEVNSGGGLPPGKDRQPK